MTQQSIEQVLCQVAHECDVWVSREADETLAAFADRVIEEIAEKILELDARIDEIRQLYLHEET